MDGAIEIVAMVFSAVLLGVAVTRILKSNAFSKAEVFLIFFAFVFFLAPRVNAMTLEFLGLKGQIDATRQELTQTKQQLVATKEEVQEAKTSLRTLDTQMRRIDTNTKTALSRIDRMEIGRIGRLEPRNP